MSFPFTPINIRIKFTDGPQEFTVEYMPSLKMWFVFKDDMTTDCLYKKDQKKIPKCKDINLESATDVLHEYLETIIPPAI